MVVMRQLAVGLVVLVLLAGCSPEDPAPAASPGASPSPTPTVSAWCQQAFTIAEDLYAIIPETANIAGEVTDAASNGDVAAIDVALAKLPPLSKRVEALVARYKEAKDNCLNPA